MAHTITNKDGVTRDMTEDEISDFEARKADLTSLKQAEAEADAQLVTDKVNAKAKLIVGEALTEAEADTIVL